MEPLFNPSWLFKRDEVEVPIKPVPVQVDPLLYAHLQETIHRLHGEPHMVPLLTYDFVNGPQIPSIGNAFNTLSNTLPTSNAIRYYTPISSVDLLDYIDERQDKKRKNKLDRKNREGVKASDNATGRKWWEHR